MRPMPPRDLAAAQPLPVGTSVVSGTVVALAKLHLSESFVQSSLQAIQVFGGYGYSTEYGIERDLRDALGGRIYSGTSEIQREIVARALGL